MPELLLNHEQRFQLSIFLKYWERPEIIDPETWQKLLDQCQPTITFKHLSVLCDLFNEHHVNGNLVNVLKLCYDRIF